MNSIFKKNLSLTIGVLLPVLVVLIILVTNFMSQKLVADPHYGIIYTNTAADYLKLNIVDGRMTLRLENSNSKEQSITIPKIFFYNVTTKETKQLLPDEQTNADVSIPGKGFKTFTITTESISKISKLHTSPDGYRVEKRGYQGLLSLLWFSTHFNERHIFIKKASRPFKIETMIDHPQFFAWALEK